MKTIHHISFATLLVKAALSFGQNNATLVLDSTLNKLKSINTVNTLINKGKTIGANANKDSLHQRAHQLYYGTSTTQFHMGWEDGRAPEFSNAYTLKRHEVRLNVLGRSSFAFTDRLELSSYLPLSFIMPNASLKYRFMDNGTWAMAAEAGSINGLLPTALATGMLLPGGAFGVATAGFIRGNDKHLKLYTTWHPTNNLSLTAKGSVSFLKVGYTGIAGGVVVGGDGVAGIVLPVNGSKRFNYFSGGIEADYVINQKNVLVLNSAIGGFENAKSQLAINSLCWTHAQNAHFHYTLGVYNFVDPPTYDVWKDEMKKVPVGVYANVYWIFNNRIK